MITRRTLLLCSGYSIINPIPAMSYALGDKLKLEAPESVVRGRISKIFFEINIAKQECCRALILSINRMDACELAVFDTLNGPNVVRGVVETSFYEEQDVSASAFFGDFELLSVRKTVKVTG